MRLRIILTTFVMRLTTFMTAFVVLAVPALYPCAASANDSLAPTPPMGWSCYHWFGTEPSEEMIRKAADAIVASGLKDAGYSYVNIDDGWMAGERDSEGRLVPDPVRFPHGMKTLVDYIHAKGLKAGIYLTCGLVTYQDLPGSLGHETEDAGQIAAWGFDFLKYDYRTLLDDPKRDCRAEMIRMSTALKKTGRPILYSMCEHGRSKPWEWAAGYADMWRVSTDIKDQWDGEFEGGWGFNKIVDEKEADLSGYAGPGHWNDPDMLIVGLHGRQKWMGPGCSDVEYRANFSLWCLLAAPLILGVDPSDMSNAVAQTVSNPEMIVIDQDSLGHQAHRVRTSQPGCDIWVKPLSGGNFAVGLYNRLGEQADIAVRWEDLGLPQDAPATVRDVWAKNDCGTCTGRVSHTVGAHECAVLIISPRR
jgi:alpha-galactosidase